MAAGQDFIASLSGMNFQTIVTNLQQLVLSVNALNVALTRALANVANPNG